MHSRFDTCWNIDSIFPDILSVRRISAWEKYTNLHAHTQTHLHARTHTHLHARTHTPCRSKDVGAVYDACNRRKNAQAPKISKKVISNYILTELDLPVSNMFLLPSRIFTSSDFVFFNVAYWTHFCLLVCTFQFILYFPAASRFPRSCSWGESLLVCYCKNR